MKNMCVPDTKPSPSSSSFGQTLLSSPQSIRLLSFSRLSKYVCCTNECGNNSVLMKRKWYVHMTFGLITSIIWPSRPLCITQSPPVCPHNVYHIFVSFHLFPFSLSWRTWGHLVLVQTMTIMWTRIWRSTKRWKLNVRTKICRLEMSELGEKRFPKRSVSISGALRKRLEIIIERLTSDLFLTIRQNISAHWKATRTATLLNE